ncbi:MAG: class I SAM-dependent methyltransferase [bacterium]|nr:class I SAM-dependent methyltransferase [bacterium]
MKADPASWAPYAQALLDYAEGKSSGCMELVQEDGERWLVHPSCFFRGFGETGPVERTALDLVSGKVLDLGAGAGRHSLALQERGFEVQALELCPEAAALMRRRGVRHVVEGDVSEMPVEGPFDTFLMLMNGIGLVGGLDGLASFLDKAAGLLAAGGQILLDSTDLRWTEPRRRYWPRLAARVREGRYWGEARQRIVYQGTEGTPPLAWLYVDAATLALYARRNGWKCQVIRTANDGNYLARLTREEDHGRKSSYPLSEERAAETIEILFNVLRSYGPEPGPGLGRRLIACRDVELLAHWLSEALKEETAEFLRARSDDVPVSPESGPAGSC